MKLWIPFLLIILLGVSVACSSTGSGTIRKDIYGNITGHWQLVIDDNGYITYVYVEGKPGALIVDENGQAHLCGAYAGEICDYSARLLLFETEEFYTVEWITPDRFILTPCCSGPPSIIAVRLRFEE